MTFVVIERALITTAILTELETLGFPVGDNSSPTTQYGWQGEPNQEGTNFTPWIGLTAMPGNGVGQELASLASRAEWLLSYSVFVAGVNREQSERLADKCRQTLANFSNTLVAGTAGNWMIQGVACVNLGSNNRVGEAVPYYFTQVDSYQAYVTEG